MALHGLPLDSIHVTTSPFDSNSRVALEWLMKRMHGASQATYTYLPHHNSEFMDRPHDTLDIVRKQECGTLSNLQKLKLEINTDLHHDWSTWMKGLLRLASNLVVLELRLVMCPLGLPVMGNLRHLDIDVAQASSSLPRWDFFPRCLRHLHCLKTLGLRRSLACSGQQYEVYELPRSLEYLCLKHYLPYGLTVPPECKVSHTGKACCLDKPQRQQQWKALQPAVTRLVTHTTNENFDWEYSVGTVLPSLEALTLIAEDCHGPTYLDWAPEWRCRDPVLEDLYVQSLPGEQLKHLTSLMVAANSICITLPAALRLRRLCLVACSKLCLHFESAGESARHLQAFDIACRYLLHQEPIDALQTALQKKDIGLICALDDFTQVQHIRSSPRLDADTCWYRECGCMCCSECLAKSGMAVSQGNGEVPTELHGAAIEDGRSTAAPHVPFLRDIMAPMSYLEGGCVEATPWTPSIISRSPLGSPGPGDSHLCIEDVSDEIVEVDDVDWESSPPRSPSMEFGYWPGSPTVD
ncbi:g13502 [Coccomyxa viridis]|uniref:G13502 protein n=1 Tax=Coccomyxa viridis TaxID=1274662 RepID=A0ABP1GK16_9CHLO